MHNLVDSIFSNTESTIGGIDKAWAHLKMGTYKYRPNYNSSHRKWVWYYIYCIQTDHWWLSICGDYINMRLKIQTVGQTYKKTFDKFTGK